LIKLPGCWSTWSSTSNNAVYEQILTEPRVGRLNEISQGLDALAAAATKIQVVGDTEVEQQHETQTQDDRTRSAELSLARDSRVGWKSDQQHQRSRRKLERKVSRGRETHHLLLGPLSSAIQALAAALEPKQMWLLLDEWSALPVDLQPLVADLLRRTFFAAGGIVVKISAIHGRSRFTDAAISAAPLGLELGADTAASLDLDDFLLFRNDAAATIDFYAALIFRHFTAMAVRADRPDQALPGGVQTPNQLIEQVFADRGSFHNLVVGAEGVPRDALQIAGLAAGAADSRPITAMHIAAATRDYFLRDKQGHLPEPVQAVFANLAEQCVRQKSRIIPLRRDRESNEDAIQRLYDTRLIHRVRQGVSLDPQHPAEVYDVYVLDYGCFLGLLRDGRIRGIEAGLDPGARFADTNEIEIRARTFVRLPTGWYQQRADQHS